MDQDKALSILKDAILGEKRGEVFYETVAKQTENEGVRDFFLSMAEDEKYHQEILAEQYKNFSSKKAFLPPQTKEASKLAVDILKPEVMNAISAASYEASAISAAMLMEKNAITAYTERAKETDDKSEKDLYTWLATWEESHLDDLVQLDNQLREKVWYDNNFWPM